MSLQIISIILGSLTLASALMVVLSKHPVRSVIYLVVTFFFITSMYIMMNAREVIAAKEKDGHDGRRNEHGGVLCKEIQTKFHGAIFGVVTTHELRFTLW